MEIYEVLSSEFQLQLNGRIILITSGNFLAQLSRSEVKFFLILLIVFSCML